MKFDTTTVMMAGSVTTALAGELHFAMWTHRRQAAAAL
jgi:hypothetical protein